MLLCMWTEIRAARGRALMKPFAKAFYKSKQWQSCRKSYINKRIALDGGLCEKCRQEPGYIVHHKVTLTPENINNPEITLNHQLLQYDCKTCHDREEQHAFVKERTLKCKFDESGQPYPPFENP